MGFDQRDYKTETGYGHVISVGDQNVTVEVSFEPHYSVIWRSEISASSFLRIARQLQLPDISSAEAVAYTWSSGRNFETTAADLMLELAGLGAEDFDKDYGFLRLDLDAFTLVWQVMPQRYWSEIPPKAVQYLVGLASAEIDADFVYELFNSTRSIGLRDDLVDGALLSALYDVSQKFKEADWSAVLSKPQE
jgi:hypothetical protein